MLPLLRPIIRRSPRLNIQGSHPILPLRLQHGQHGPHKEYFQHPSQFPSNAYQLRVPPPEQRIKHDQHEPSRTSSSPTESKRPSFARRLIRSTLIISLSLALGWAAGTAIITFDYIQPPLEPGTEEAEELVEEVLNILDTCALVEDLREHGFQEETMTRPLNSGQHLVTNTLNDVQGFKTKFFRHPEQPSFSVLVFFAGFGIEGYPDYVHGGAITTIMTEAAQQHCAPMLGMGDLEALPSGQFANITFFEPVRPAEVYAVLVQESSASLREREVGGPSGYYESYEPEVAVAHNLNTFLVYSDSFPKEMLEYFGSTHIEEIPASELEAQTNHSTAESIGNENHVQEVLQMRSVHAFAQIDVMTKSKHVTKKDGESLDDFGERLSVEMQRVLRKIHSPRQAGTRKDDGP